jgi:pyridoxamine 5'-phosphate oxidase-like protein
MPRPARDILDQGTLCYLAVRTSRGPHVTPVVFALHGNRLWLTTSRGSVKARAWRADRTVAGLVHHGDAAVAFRGTARIYDAFDPFTWPAAALAGPRLVTAGTRFTLKNARFFAGYAVDARRVPLSWTPPGRVFVSVELASGKLLSEGLPRAGWGDWPVGAEFVENYRSLPERPPIDRGVPRALREALGESGNGALALQSGEVLTVLPASWCRVARSGSYHAVLPVGTLELAGVPARTTAALTVDHASTWRAADMKGMLIQGRGEMFSVHAANRGRQALRSTLGDGSSDRALVRIRPDRVVWWRGWRSRAVKPDR